MEWLIFAILSALFHATTQALSKYNLLNLKPTTVGAAKFGFAAPFLLALMIIKGPAIQDTTTFWYSLFIASALNTLATFLIMKALKISPLSLSIPFMSFTPVFLIFVAFIFLGEIPSLYGIVGICLVVIGSYLMNIKSISNGIFQPFKDLKDEKGPLLVFTAAFIISMVATFAKKSMLSSNTHTFIFGFALLQAIILSFFSISEIRAVFKKSKELIVLGISQALSEFFAALALVSAYASFAVSVKRTSLIFSVLIGYFFFKEKNIAERLVGTALMVAGVIIISLS